MLRTILFPPFLRSIDKYLLIHNPSLWTTRIHMFAWGLLLFTGISVGLGVWMPLHLYDLPDLELNFLIGEAFAFGGFLLWGAFASMFNVENQFGKITNVANTRNHLIYVLGAALLIVPPFIYAEITNYRIAHLVSRSELSEDVNALNLGNYYALNRSRSEYDESPQTEVEVAFMPPYSRSYEYNSDSQFFIDYPAIQTSSKLTASLANTDAKRLLQIEKGIIAWNKYNESWVNVRAEAVLENWKAGNTTYGYFHENYQLDNTLQKVFKAQLRAYPFQEVEFYTLMFLFAILASLGLSIVQTIQIRKFIIAAATAAIGGFAVIMVATVVHEFANIPEQTLFPLAYLAVLVGLVSTYNFQFISKHLTLIKEVCLSIAAVMISFTPIVMAEFLDLNPTKNHNIAFYLVLCSVMGFLGWRLFIRPMLSKLKSAPSKV